MREQNSNPGKLLSGEPSNHARLWPIILSFQALSFSTLHASFTALTKRIRPFLQTFTSSPSPDSRHSLMLHSPWAATQRNFLELWAHSFRSAVSGSDPLTRLPQHSQPAQQAFSLNRLLLFSHRQALLHCFLYPFQPCPSLGSHILPWGPLPGPKKSVTVLFSTSNISILKTHICILMAPVPARKGYTLMHIYFGEESFPGTVSNFPLWFKCILWSWPDLLGAKTDFSQHLQVMLRPIR